MPIDRPFDLEDLDFIRVGLSSILKTFDCGDDDNNDFFHNDSFKYLRELLAVTYTFENEVETIGFFSVLNDKIINKDSLFNRIICNRLARSIPNEKRRPTYPAVKIGRLGVMEKYTGMEYGTDMLNFIKHWFTDNNKTGCRFITVDAYNKRKVINFYEKNGFEFLTDNDKNDNTRLMWFSLKTFRE